MTHTDLEEAVERAAAILKAWNRRETDLLEANNRYLERARAAETALASITRERDAMREALVKARAGLQISAGWANRPDRQNARAIIKSGLDAIRISLRGPRSAEPNKEANPHV